MLPNFKGFLRTMSRENIAGQQWESGLADSGRPHPGLRMHFRVSFTIPRTGCASESLKNRLGECSTSSLNSFRASFAVVHNNKKFLKCFGRSMFDSKASYEEELRMFVYVVGGAI